MAASSVVPQQPTPASVCAEADDFLLRVGDVYDNLCNDASTSALGEYAGYVGVGSCYSRADLLFDGLDVSVSRAANADAAGSQSPQPSDVSCSQTSVVYPWMKRRRHRTTGGIHRVTMT